MGKYFGVAWGLQSCQKPKVLTPPSLALAVWQPSHRTCSLCGCSHPQLSGEPLRKLCGPCLVGCPPGPCGILPEGREQLWKHEESDMPGFQFSVGSLQGVVDLPQRKDPRPFPHQGCRQSLQSLLSSSSVACRGLSENVQRSHQIQCAL